MKKSIGIIGAGLTGLTLAYRLQKAGIHNFIILEARNRIGGRIQTIYQKDRASLEMGATWLGKKHTSLLGLLEELNIPIFEQYLGPCAWYDPISTSPPQLAQLPPNPEPSYRISGGSFNLIQHLAEHINTNQILIDEQVKSIRNEPSFIEVTTNKQTYHFNYLISTLPPKLLVDTINIEPNLPSSFSNIAQNTHTWMGESIKVAITYKEAFWRQPNSSGTIFSNVGPLNEFYDHSNPEENLYALKGFMSGAYHGATKEERKTLVLKQLRKYYGTQADDYMHYEDCVWRKEKWTFTDYDSYILPHQHNSHPVFQQSFWDGHLWIGGSETAPQFGGYMDGAVRSAATIFRALHLIFSK